VFEKKYLQSSYLERCRDDAKCIKDFWVSIIDLLAMKAEKHNTDTRCGHSDLTENFAARGASFLVADTSFEQVVVVYYTLVLIPILRILKNGGSSANSMWFCLYLPLVGSKK
jgi:hypothetical protein